jgi:phage terminase small subunit
MAKLKRKASPKKRVKAGTSSRCAMHRKLLFVEAMLANGGNQTKSAEAAGFSAAGAAVRGAELVKDRKVQEELARRRRELLDKAKLTSEEVLISMAHAVRFDPRKLYRDDGTLKAVHELDEATAMALTALEVTEESNPKGGKVTVTRKLRWLDKNAAREQAHKHFGHYEKDNVQRTDVLRSFYEDVMNETRGLPSAQRKP